ncbi:MAG: hypothetical protein JXA44_05650 [Methanospirillaceae archaeon]|nr:hypothetical protein [Methanospirillaceae archaeon]
MEEIRVCIVSSDGRIAAAIRTLIMSAGLGQSKTVTDPDGLILSFEKQKPSIVLIDKSLSSGTEDIMKAVAACDAAQIPYLLLSGQEKENRIQIPDNSGFFGYLTLPAEPDTVSSSIRASIHRHQTLIRMKSWINEIKKRSQALGIRWWTWERERDLERTDSGIPVYENGELISVPEREKNSYSIITPEKVEFPVSFLSLQALSLQIDSDNRKCLLEAAEQCKNGNVHEFCIISRYNGESPSQVFISGTVSGDDGERITRIDGIAVPLPCILSPETGDESSQDISLILSDTWNEFPFPCSIWEVIYDEEVGRPVDLLCRHGNKAFSSLFHREQGDVTGQYATIIFTRKQVPYLDRYAEVSWNLSQKTFRCRLAEGWYEVILFSPMQGLVAAISRDIGVEIEREKDEKKHNAFQSLFESPGYGTFSWNQADNTIDLDMTSAGLLDISRQNRSLSIDTLLHLVHPDENKQGRMFLERFLDPPVPVMSTHLRFRIKNEWTSCLMTIGTFDEEGGMVSGGRFIVPCSSGTSIPCENKGTDCISDILHQMGSAKTLVDAGAACIPAILSLTGMDEGILVKGRNHSPDGSVVYRTGTHIVSDAVITDILTAFRLYQKETPKERFDPIFSLPRPALTGTIAAEETEETGAALFLFLCREEEEYIGILLYGKRNEQVARKKEITEVLQAIKPSFNRILQGLRERELMTSLMISSLAGDQIPFLVSGSFVSFPLHSPTLPYGNYHEDLITDNRHHRAGMLTELAEPILEAATPVLCHASDKNYVSIGITHKNGEQKEYAVHLRAVEFEDKRMIAGTLQDITRIVRERDYLLSRIFGLHREEQEILDLISRTGDSAPPPYGFLLSPDTRIPAERVFALATAHETWYLEGENETDADPYLLNLSQRVLSWIPHPSRVTVSVAAGNTFIQQRHLIPLSLMVTELLAFILRHAFTATREGTIIISFSQECDPSGSGEREYHLRISDDGLPMPEGWNPDETEENEIEFIYHLVQVRLLGTIRYARGETTTWDIRYPDS